jgi:crotonobetainyl-CoA:carnitine CoA-transferase CaiB-like acyl-CoA transferase
VTSEKSPRIVDFSTHFSGPVASRQLVQLGADVIKVENPRHGDGNRGEPSTDGIGIHHLYLNPGTRSIAVDAKSEGWPALVKALTGWADVVIVGNRAASAKRMGIDFATLREHNPELVYCLITGYGLDGPLAEFPAHGLNMDALAGAVPVEWEDGRPVAPESYRSVGTTLAGIEAAIGIYAALHRRDRGAGAQFVHVSVWESALAWMWRDLTQYANTGERWQIYKGLGSRYCMYKTADDAAVLVCPLEKHFWERFCDVVGLEHLKSRGDWSDAGMDYGRAYTGEREEIQERMVTKTRPEWVALLAEADVPVAPVLDWREAMDTEHARANGVMAEYEYHGRTFRIPTTPVSIVSASDGDVSLEHLADRHRRKHEVLTPPPDLGEQTDEILEELGAEDLAGKLRR